MRFEVVLPHDLRNRLLAQVAFSFRVHGRYVGAFDSGRVILIPTTLTG
jgi:hypothetical protein